MLSERSRQDVWEVFAEYEYIVSIVVFVVITTSCVLIMPFVSIYTSGISDANYYDINIAILMTVISFFELIHIPSGHLLNMAGEFKVSKNIQVISLCVLVIFMSILGFLFGIYGVLYAVLIVAILLAFLEIGYIHISFFKHKLSSYFRLTMPFSVSTILLSWIEFNLFEHIVGIKLFVSYGLLITIMNIFFAIIIGFVFNMKMSRRVLSRCYSLLKNMI